MGCLCREAFLDPPPLKLVPPCVSLYVFFVALLTVSNDLAYLSAFYYLSLPSTRILREVGVCLS